MTSVAVSLSELPNLIGSSPAFCAALQLIKRMARCDAPVLIQGETGTGKELAARAIHYLSVRRDRPFVPVNCGAVPETLIESELFGCVRGAFTDARQARDGLAAAADGGTLFLDEVDALPMRAQTALLRFLQEHTFRRVGATREEHVNVRVLAASSPRLAKAVREGSFRDDLAFRLDVLALKMPPLRERGDDVLILAEHFVRHYAAAHKLAVSHIGVADRRWLLAHGWPGNVRELDNLIQRAVLLGDGPIVDLIGKSRWPIDREAAAPTVLKSDSALLPSFNDARADALRHFELQYLETVMTVAFGNVSCAARISGKERRAMGKLLKRNGIDRGHFARSCDRSAVSSKVNSEVAPLV